MRVIVGKKYKTKYGVMTCERVFKNKADFMVLGFKYLNVPCSLIHIKPTRN